MVVQEAGPGEEPLALEAAVIEPELNLTTFN